jgi:predicted RND superfamily exporter protein
MEVLKQINGGELPDNFSLSVLYKRLPDEVKQSLIAPYLSADGNQLRFAVRVYESDVSLKRQALLEKIRRQLTGELRLSDNQVHLSGMLVLYNNMLQSLFRSQILTLGAVLLAVLLMFVLLFRSVRLALIAIVPSLIAVPLVLGLMGGLDIPLIASARNWRWTETTKLRCAVRTPASAEPCITPPLPSPSVFPFWSSPNSSPPSISEFSPPSQC